MDQCVRMTLVNRLTRAATTTVAEAINACCSINLEIFYFAYELTELIEFGIRSLENSSHSVNS